MNLILLHIIVLGVFSGVAVGCNKYEYSYNVVDCKEPQIQALGEYILARLKTQREIRTSTCYNDNMDFLQLAPFASRDAQFDARKLAGAWILKHTNDPSAVFSGPEATLEALKNQNSYNILIDKKLMIHKYVLRNSTNGDISIAFLTEDDLMGKVANEKYWDHYDILECTNFLFHLSKTVGNQIVSVTLVNKENSNDELRYILKTSGVGGFYKLPSEEPSME